MKKKENEKPKRGGTRPNAGRLAGGKNKTRKNRDVKTVYLRVESDAHAAFISTAKKIRESNPECFETIMRFVKSSPIDDIKRHKKPADRIKRSDGIITTFRKKQE